MAELRMTYATALVLQALSRGLRYGFDIADATGLRGGTVYPVLRRLERQSLVSSEWEDVETSSEEGRPPRRYYRLLSEAERHIRMAEQRFPFPARGPDRPSEATP